MLAGGVLVGLMVVDARVGAAPRRGVPAELPRVRLPDALGREARHARSRRCGASPSGRARSCAPFPACATSDRTSAAPRSPTKSSGPNFTELWISLDPSVDYDATVAKIQDVVDGYPGLYRDLLTYLRERIKEVLTGASATIVVRIEGPDLDRLQAHAAAVRDALAPIAGVVDLKAQPQVLVPQIEVKFSPERAERLGLTAGDVRRAVTTVVHGAKAGEFFEDQRFFDVVVWGTPEARGSIDAVRAIRLPVPGGSTVPLSAVADVAIAPVQNEITRENGVAAHRRHLQRVGPRPRFGRARHRGAARDARSRRGLSRRSARRVRRARRLEPIAADVGRRSRSSASS